MKNSNIWFIMFMLILLSACTGVSKKNGSTVTEIPKTDDERNSYVTMFVNFGDKKNVFDSVSLREGQSLYELLMKLELEEVGFQVMDTLYGNLGHLITGFNGVENQAPKYWTYCINGKKANRGVDEIELKNGDRIDWYYTSDTTPCE